jgi:hypothetical protein
MIWQMHEAVAGKVQGLEQREHRQPRWHLGYGVVGRLELGQAGHTAQHLLIPARYYLTSPSVAIAARVCVRAFLAKTLA